MTCSTRSSDAVLPRTARTSARVLPVVSSSVPTMSKATARIPARAVLRGVGELVGTNCSSRGDSPPVVEVGRLVYLMPTSLTSTTGDGTARDRLLDAAGRLFYANGIAATGINTITAAAGVAKMSLYNNFASKEELILAYLEARHREWLDSYRARIDADTVSPRDGVAAVFDAYIDHAEQAFEHGFRGCGLLNAAAELPAGSAGRDAVRRHKEEVEEILVGHLSALIDDETRAAELAEHCSFLLEGAMARSGLEGQPERLQHAKRIAMALIDALDPAAR